jgi:hypothetical protein
LLQRLEVERRGALRLRLDHRFEHPEAERELESERPVKARGGSLRTEGGVDLDGHPVLVLAAQPEPRPRRQLGHAAIEDRRPAGDGLADAEPRADPQGALIESFDADDARGDQPFRVALDVDQ